MADNIYCGNARVINTKFGDITKVSMSKSDINKIVGYMKQENLEWVNLEVLSKRNPEEGKPTHYVRIDTYKPAPKNETGLPESESQTDEGDDDSLPF